MRARGQEVTVAPLPDLPAELTGKVVQVTVGPERAPVFVREDVCRSLDQGK